MDEYCYYQVEYNEDGFLLQYYSTEEGYLETYDSCNFDDEDRLKIWHVVFGAEIPSSSEISALRNKEVAFYNDYLNSGT